MHLHETIVAGAGQRLLLDALRPISLLRHVVEHGPRLDRQRRGGGCWGSGRIAAGLWLARVINRL